MYNFSEEVFDNISIFHHNLIIMFTVGVITLLATAAATCTPPCSPEIYRSFNLTSRATLGKGLDWILGTTTTTTIEMWFTERALLDISGIFNERFATRSDFIMKLYYM